MPPENETPKPQTIALIWAIIRCLKGMINVLEKYVKGEIIRNN
jgi:hypothetical protein